MEFLDDQLPPAHAAVVQAHVETCDTCRRLSAELRGISRDVSRWEVGETPATLVAPPQMARTISRRLSSFVLAHSTVLVVSAFAVAAGAVLSYSTYNMIQPKQVMVRRAPSRPETGGRPEVMPQATEPKASYYEQIRGDTRASVEPQPSAVVLKGPAIARVARLRLTTRDFDTARVGVERLVGEKGGWFRQFEVTGSQGKARTLRATIFVQVTKLDELMSGTRPLGTLIDEWVQAEDVSEQLVDVQARLTNARNTEGRLVDLLRTRTGKLEEVLEAEREVSRVREEIERLDAQRQNLERRVTYATLTLDISELRASVDLGPRPVSSRLSDAFQAGWGQGLQGLVDLMFIVVRVLPILVIWGVVLAWPLRMLWRWARRDAPTPRE